MTRAAPRPACVVGAYAIAPSGDDELHELLAALIRLPGVTGFELPLGWLSAVRAEPLLRDLLDGGHHVLTVIGATAAQAARDPEFGLASTDTDGRRRAVELVRAACDEVTALAERGIRVAAVEVHSWPSVPPDRASDGTSPLAESLSEIAGWSWAGAAVVLEHCDARVAGRPWQKGLLPLSVEAEAVRTVRASSPRTHLGMSVNWGRSAIEGRDPALPLQHIQDLRTAGLLDGLVFSGAAAHAGVYGPEWSDVHLPLREDQPESVLDRAAVAECLAAAGPPALFTGVKVAAPDSATAIPLRVASVRHVLDAMQEGAASRGRT